MIYVNRHNTEFLIAHFQGDRAQNDYNFIMWYMEQAPVSVPSNIAIVTFATKDIQSKVWLIDQLRRNDIPYHNAARNLRSYQWSNTFKPNLAAETLRNVKQEYSLVLDGQDVLLVKPLAEIFDRFAIYKKPVLFGATKNNYPALEDPPETAPWNEDYRFLNAGTAFGRTVDLLAVYESVAAIAEEIGENPYDSEQFLVREVYRQNRNFIGFDHQSAIFQTFGRTDMTVIDDETVGFR